MTPLDLLALLDGLRAATAPAAPTTAPTPAAPPPVPEPTPQAVRAELDAYLAELDGKARDQRRADLFRSEMARITHACDYQLGPLGHLVPPKK